MKAKAFDRSAFVARLIALDKVLVAKDFPPMSRFWKDTLTRFFQSGRRELVLRVGRRGGKSSTLARVAVTWALFGAYAIPPGDVGVVAFVSVSRDESAQRLRTIEAILGALEIPYRRAGDVIELDGRPVVFKTFTASISGVSGFTAIMVIGDELAKWRDSDTGSNPSRQVVASVKPTVATQPYAPIFWSSSAFSKSDHHAELFALGDTESQLVAQAATWIANPSITEAETHLLERDPATHLREYGAVPSDSAQSDWFGSALNCAITDAAPPELRTTDRPIIAIDPGFAIDKFGYAVVASRQSDTIDPISKRPLRVTWTYEVGAWKAEGKPRETMARLRSEVCGKYYRDREFVDVYTDQAEFWSLREIARDSRINLLLVPWVGGSGEGSKLSRFRACRLAMRQGEFFIPSTPSLVRSFRSVQGILTAAGNERIEIPRVGGSHGDDVSALILAGSVALERSPAETPAAKPAVPQEERWRQEAIRWCERRRAAEWKRSPMAVMRRAINGR